MCSLRPYKGPPIEVPADIRAKVVEACRSGKYRHGSVFLRSAADEFCELGLLLDVMGVDWGPLYDGAYHPDYYERERLIKAANFWPVIIAVYDERGAGGFDTFPAFADWLETHTVSRV